MCPQYRQAAPSTSYAWLPWYRHHVFPNTAHLPAQYSQHHQPAPSTPTIRPPSPPVIPITAMRLPSCPPYALYRCASSCIACTYFPIHTLVLAPCHSLGPKGLPHVTATASGCLYVHTNFRPGPMGRPNGPSAAQAVACKLHHMYPMMTRAKAQPPPSFALPSCLPCELYDPGTGYRHYLPSPGVTRVGSTATAVTESPVYTQVPWEYPAGVWALLP